MNSIDVTVFYATRDGQSRKIAHYVADHVRERGLSVELRDLRAGLPTASEIEAIPRLVVIASIRYGYHLPEATRFLRERRSLLAERLIALASVNLTARKPGKSTIEGNVYLRKWLKRHRLSPLVAAAIAGRLDYPRYVWWERFLVQMIMTISGGPTAPETVVEYTDWALVEAFAGRVADCCGSVRETVPR